MASHRGDDLDDDFVPDDSVALSDGENVTAADDPGSLLSADEDEDTEANADPQQAVSEKKRKRREKDKERKLKKRKLVESTEPVEPPSVAAQPPATISDYMSAMQAKAFPSLSAIELQDRQIPGRDVHSGYDSMDGIEEFGPFGGFYRQSAGAALRVVDLTRTLRSKMLRGEKGGEVAKLFAKHFKLEDHVKYLKRTKVGAAVGTPGRIGKLLCDTDALTISALTHIVLDVSYRDTKNRSLLDIPETRDEVFKTVLAAPQVLQAIKAGKIQIVLF